MAFIFDFFICEEFRNKGYGTRTLYEVEKDAKQYAYGKADRD